MRLREQACGLCGLAIGLIAMAASVGAAQGATKGSKPDTSAREVEMFSAMKSGDIEVKLIPRNESEARVLIKNKTDKPLNVRLPEAFAGIPVLGQAAAGGRRNRDNNNNNTNNNNANQGLGGGFGGGGFGGGGFGGGGMGGGGMGGGGQGFFNVPPEKVGQLRVKTVCLEHGKQNPRAAIPYDIKPIESLTSKPEVQEFVKLFGQGRFSQQAAQAAAWHLSSGMSWQELASKRVEHLNGQGHPYFTPMDLREGQQIVHAAIVQARQRATESRSESTSLSTSR